MNVRTAAFALAAALSVLSAASICAEAQALKIGVFDAERISEETAEGAKIKARLTKLQDEKRKQLETVQNELQAMQQEFLASSTSLSEDKRKEMGLKIQRKQNEFEGMQKTANQEMQVEVEAAQLGWQRRVIEVVQKYGKDNGFTVILPVEVVPYYSAAIDLTQELVKVVDQAAAAPKN
ncbi:MAG: OmpH family outer membrane protein [Acidobacteria bacterium]|nr:OmpH family outer membrane protein [Acidobacteriota bacterium]